MNNIWLPCRSDDRPRAVPKGATNLGLMGQYVEVPQTSRSPSNTLPAAPGRRFTHSPGVGPRRPFISPSTIRRDVRLREIRPGFGQLRTMWAYGLPFWMDAGGRDGLRPAMLRSPVVTRAAASWRAFQARGIISLRRDGRDAGSLARASASQARGSTSLCLQVSISE